MNDIPNDYPEGSELWIERMRYVLADRVIEAQKELIEFYEAGANKHV